MLTKNTKYLILLNQFNLFNKLLNKFSALINFYPYYTEIILSDSKFLLDLLFILKHHMKFQLKTLVDLVVVDKLDLFYRFKITYVFMSIQYNVRILVSLEILPDEPLPSIWCLFSSANWLEREVWDLFGIFITNHPDLRRILTDYGFIGSPLRKEFPITGFFEIYYDDSRKRILTDFVSLSQEYRNFDYLLEWYEEPQVLLHSFLNNNLK